jgi:hypothetical protein
LNSRSRITALILATTIVLSFLPSISLSYGQSPPVPPPPAPTTEGSNEEDVREPTVLNDKSAPVIEVLNKDLTEGKNLIRAKVTDDSSVSSVRVRYVENGFVTAADLVHEEGTTYKGLIEVLPPSSVLIFEAVDAEGNLGQETQWLSVSPIQKNFIDQFMAWIRSLFS